MPLYKARSNTSKPTIQRPPKLLAALAFSKSPYRLNDSPCTVALNTLLLPTLLPVYAVALIATCTKPPTSKAREDTKLKSPFATAPYMPRAQTTARCVTGAVGLGTTSKTVTVLGTATTAHAAVTTELTVSTPMTFVMRMKTVRSIPPILTSNAATALQLTMTLTSKGC